MLKRERKRRAEAADAYRKGGRADAAAAEDAEAELIDVYLPAQISDDELQQLVADALAETGAQSQKEMGRVMSAVMAKAQGRADGRRVSELVKERLGRVTGPTTACGASSHSIRPSPRSWRAPRTPC